MLYPKVSRAGFSQVLPAARVFPLLDPSREVPAGGAESPSPRGPPSSACRSALVLDEGALDSLGVLAAGSSQRGTLFELIARAQTVPGRRLVRRWLGEPSTDADEIAARLDVVAWAGQRPDEAAAFRRRAARVPDLEQGLPAVVALLTGFVAGDQRGARRAEVARGLDSVMIHGGAEEDDEVTDAVEPIQVRPRSRHFLP